MPAEWELKPADPTVPGMASPPVEPSNTSSAALVASLVAQGYSVVELDSTGDITAASRGQYPFDTDPADVVYLIKDGTYIYTGSPIAWILVGGLSASRKRYFIGESRHGTVITSRFAVEIGADHVVIQNMKFNVDRALTGSDHATIWVGASDVEIRDLTMVADGFNGAKNGGAIEIPWIGPPDSPVNSVIVDNCLVDSFGRCGTPEGHQDHGVYTGGCTNLSITNCIIRNNSSRGIQIYVHGDGTPLVDNLLVSNNWIYSNGHADWEDGIVINDSGNQCSDVTIERNFIYDNYYSAIRFIGVDMTNILIRYNTIVDNASGSSASARSEINFDVTGDGADTSITKNIICPAYQCVNNGNGEADDAATRGFAVDDNVIYGTVPGTPACITNRVNADPQFIDRNGRDYHAQNPAVAAYGVYGS